MNWKSQAFLIYSTIKSPQSAIAFLVSYRLSGTIPPIGGTQSGTGLFVYLDTLGVAPVSRRFPLTESDLDLVPQFFRVLSVSGENHFSTYTTSGSHC